MYLRSIIHPLYVSLAFAAISRAGSTPAAPTFYKDILPIVQVRCQPCHRPGELGPMPLLTMDQIRANAKPMVERVKNGTMPPWYSDKCCGQFSPEHTLTRDEISAIETWVNSGMPEGKKKDAPKPVKWEEQWRIDGPSVVVSLPRAFEVPAGAQIPDQFVILPLDLAEDKWASAIEIHPSDRSVVHHAVLYVRSKESKWLREIPKLTMYAAPDAGEPSLERGVDILTVYSAGNPASIWPEGAGKKLPAGADLVLRIHYEGKRVAATDRTSVGINFLKERPEKRVLTFVLEDRDLKIPAGVADYRRSITAVLTRDVLLVSMLPHMHLRGAGFSLGIDLPGGVQRETLIDSRGYDAAWEQSFPLKTLRFLPKGTKLIWTATYDNSEKNRHNPDAKAEVHWGEQSASETMSAYFDIAVDVNVERIGASRP